jgi:hypothetical protein
MHSIERVLQGCLQIIESWADNNGFRFSKSKTVCMHFCTKHTLHPDPCLKLYTCEVPVVCETKFLGLIFDSKLSFKSHIACVKEEMLESDEPVSVLFHTRTGELTARLFYVFTILL